MVVRLESLLRRNIRMKIPIKMLLTLSLVFASTAETNTPDTSITPDTNSTSHTNSTTNPTHTTDTNSTTGTTSTADTNVTMQGAASSPSDTILASPTERHAEMIFDDLYHLVFKGNKMLKLQQCLCNSTVSSCETTINRLKKSTYEYKFRANSTEAEVLDGDYSGETFICHAGDFGLLEKFTCTRHADSFERCSRQRNCRFVHFQSGDVRGCKSSLSKCINLGLSGYTVEFRNFTGLAEFREGSCEEIPSPTATTNAPVTEGMLKDDAGNEDSLLIIIAAVGWGLFILTVIIILFIYVCWRIPKRTAQQKESASEKSQVHHNESYGLQSISHGDGRNNVQTPTTPLQVKYEEALTNTEQHEDSPYQDCVEDDDVYTVIDDENGTERAEESTKTDAGKQKNSSSNGVPSVPNTENASNKTISQCEETNKAMGNMKRPSKNQVNSTVGHLQKDAAKYDSTDAEEDYTRLKNGRSDMDRKLTDSFLATYDAAIEEIGHEITKNGRDGDNTINNLDDEENRHSGCYMLL